jgi:hypothetical protein
MTVELLSSNQNKHDFKVGSCERRAALVLAVYCALQCVSGVLKTHSSPCPAERERRLEPGAPNTGVFSHLEVGNTCCWRIGRVFLLLSVSHQLTHLRTARLPIAFCVHSLCSGIAAWTERIIRCSLNMFAFGRFSRGSLPLLRSAALTPPPSTTHSASRLCFAGDLGGQPLWSVLSFFQVLLKHFCQYPVSMGLGGMKLLRDIAGLYIAPFHLPTQICLSVSLSLSVSVSVSLS